jgi:hypothetical protein
LTPKGFYNSNLTEYRPGVARIATDGEIAARVTDAVLTAGKLTKIIQELTETSVTIGMGNMTTYLDAGGNITITAIDLRIKQVGKIVFIAGYIQGSVSSTVNAVLYFKNIPMPPVDMTQAIPVALKSGNLYPRPLGGCIDYYDATRFLLRMSVYPTLLNGAAVFVIGGQYVID